MEKNIYDEIAKVAHDLYEKSGRAQGRDVQNWLEAERIVLARYEKGAKKEKPIISSKATTKKGKPWVINLWRTVKLCADEVKHMTRHRDRMQFFL